MTGVAWPTILRPRDFGYFPLDFDVSGGVALGGGEQIVASPGPRWGAAMTLDIRTRAELLAVRTLRVQLKGRAVPVRLPNFDGQRLSWPELFVSGNPTGVVLTPDMARAYEGTLGLEGTAYAGLEIPAAAEIVAHVNADAALRATTIEIHVEQGGMLLAGQQFGIGERLYEIGGALVPVGEDFYDVSFLPPLRAAATEGTAVKFTRPICLMRCLNLNDELRKLELLRHATLNLEFAEYL